MTVKLRCARQVLRTFSVLLTAIVLLSLTVGGTVLARDHDADKDKMEHRDHDADEMEHQKRREKGQRTQEPHTLPHGEHGGDPHLYRIGAEFGLTPDEVDEILYLVETDPQMRTDMWEDHLYHIGTEFGLTPDEVDEILYLVMETDPQMHTGMWEDQKQDEMEHRDHDADEVEHRKRQEKRRRTQKSHTLPYGEHGGDPQLYRIGAEFGLTPDEVDEFLYLVMETDPQMHTGMREDQKRFFSESHPWNKRMRSGRDERMRKRERLSVGPRYDHSIRNTPVLVEVVTIRRFQMNDNENRRSYKTGYRNKDLDGGSDGWKHTGIMKPASDHERGSMSRQMRYGGPQRRAMATLGRSPMPNDAQMACMQEMAYLHSLLRTMMQPVARAGHSLPGLPEHAEGHKGTMMHPSPDSLVRVDQEHEELMAKLAWVLQDPATVRSLAPALEMFWPEIPHMVRTMTGMPMEELVQNEMLLRNLVTMVGPMLAQAIDQGLITEDMLFQLLTMLE